MTDLAERFARTQGWTKCEAINCEGRSAWNNPETGKHVDLSPLDERVLPLIWAECKANGWRIIWNIAPTHSVAQLALEADPFADYIADVALSDPITAIVTAFCEAKEATETPATPRNRAGQ